MSVFHRLRNVDKDEANALLVSALQSSLRCASHFIHGEMIASATCEQPMTMLTCMINPCTNEFGSKSVSQP